MLCADRLQYTYKCYMEQPFDMVTITNFVTVQTFLGISSTHDVAKIFTSRNFVQKCRNCIPCSLTILNEAFEGKQV